MKNLIYILIILICSVLYSVIADWNYVHRSSFFKFGKIEHLAGKRNFIFGSSSSLTGINTKKLGKKWYNLSMDNTTLIYQRSLLNYMIEKQIEIDTIVVSLDEFQSFPSSRTVNSYRYLPLLNYSKSFDELFSKKSILLYRYLPLLKYISYNSELLYPSFAAFIFPEYKYRYDSFGDFVYPKTTSLPFENIESVDVEYSDPKELELIRRLCEFNKINLVVVILPRKDVNVNMKASSVHNFSSYFTDNMYFYDAKHLNAYGRNRFTEFFINTVLSNPY